MNIIDIQPILFKNTTNERFHGTNNTNRYILNTENLINNHLDYTQYLNYGASVKTGRYLIEAVVILFDNKTNIVINKSDEGIFLDNVKLLAINYNFDTKEYKFEISTENANILHVNAETLLTLTKKYCDFIIHKKNESKSTTSNYTIEEINEILLKILDKNDIEEWLEEFREFKRNQLSKSNETLTEFNKSIVNNNEDNDKSINKIKLPKQFAIPINKLTINWINRV